MKKQTIKLKAALMIFDLMLIGIVTSTQNHFRFNGITARKKANEMAPSLNERSREFKLLVLKLLIYSKFIETQTYVSYSYLMHEMGIGYFELISLLKQIAIIDLGNDDPTTDSLVTNDGDDIPPAGHFTCGVPGREQLSTKEEYEQYHDRMMFRHCTFLNINLRAVAKTFHRLNGKVARLVPLSRHLKHNPNKPLIHSGKRYTEFNGVIREAA